MPRKPIGDPNYHERKKPKTLRFYNSTRDIIDNISKDLNITHNTLFELGVEYLEQHKFEFKEYIKEKKKKRKVG